MSEIFKYSNSHKKLLLAVKEANQQGYSFVDNVLSQKTLDDLEKEALSLQLEEGDHVTNPINKGQLQEVKQLHSRAYHHISDKEVSTACHINKQLVNTIREDFPQLKNWMPTEVGYQLYRGKNDWISPHRDRRNDQYLSITITIFGQAKIKIQKPLGHPNDYKNLETIFEIDSKPGTIMLLRAPGFGTGEQSIHEVLPPIDQRLILNLRMREDILPQPKDKNYKI